MRRSWGTPFALLLVMGVVAAGCGSDPSATDPVPESAPESTVAASSVPTEVPSSTTAAAAAPSAATITALCSEPAEVIVEQALSDLVVGSEPACVMPSALDEVAPFDQRSFDFDVEQQSSRFENPNTGVSGWGVYVALDEFDVDGVATRTIQQWSLLDQDDGSLVVDSIVVLPTDEIVAEGMANVVAYLDDLAAGRYDAAAEVLGEGGLSWEDRWDLSALPALGESSAELEAALQSWCTNGGRCDAPDSVTARPGIRGNDAEVTVTWNAEVPASASFLGGTWEGQPQVNGLPPLTTVEALGVVARTTDANVIVAELPDGRTVTWVDGSVSEVPVPAEASDPWSDGDFVYWQIWASDPDVEVMSFAADLDGTVVCEVRGSIHRVRRQPDGSHIASVEREAEAVPTPEEYPVPNYAVGCERGDETPIDPRSFRREGGGRYLERVADRQFTIDLDAEGNGDVINERGVSVNGDDYAGFHTFSPDGELVGYGDYSATVSPHVTNVVSVRDTVDGALLWSVELVSPFNLLVITDDVVVVALAPQSSGPNAWEATEALVVFERNTGRRVVTVPTNVQIIHLS